VTNIRLLPVVILAVAALLVLKTVGLVTNGGYVLSGVAVAEAASGGSSAPAAAPGETITLPSEPTIEDTTPTLGDTTATMGEGGAAAGGGHGAPAEAAAEEPASGGHGAEPDEGEVAAVQGEAAPEGHGETSNIVEATNACDPKPVLAEGAEPSADGELTVLPGDCPPLTDALPQLLTPQGPVALNAGDATLTEQALLERLSTRRGELETYEQELAMRASLVEAAEARIEERQQTLQSIEDQIASLVEQRKEMEEGQFAGIVAMYETMKPKDAANIFNALDIEVLLRVAKMMSPRKMAPILAEMDTVRAQELTVRMASASTDPLDTIAPEDLAALPQIVGQ
jgi:flagellar motility protein MotE (MotC chaperone)